MYLEHVFFFLCQYKKHHFYCYAIYGNSKDDLQNYFVKIKSQIIKDLISMKFLLILIKESSILFKYSILSYLKLLKNIFKNSLILCFQLNIYHSILYIIWQPCRSSEWFFDETFHFHLIIIASFCSRNNF